MREGFTVCLQMRLVQYIYPLTYIHKNGGLVPLFWKMFTEYLRISSHNSHRKMETVPPSKKTSLTYMYEKAVLGTMFQTVFTPCLQIPLTYKDKKQPFCRVITNFFVIADKAPYLIATGKEKV